MARHRIEFEFEFARDVDPRDVARRLRAALPAGPSVQVLGVRVLEEAEPHWRRVRVLAASGRGMPDVDRGEEGE